VVGEVGGEDKEEEKEALGRRQGNTMGEDVFALWDEQNTLGNEDEGDASGGDEGTMKLPTRSQEAYHSPASSPKADKCIYTYTSQAKAWQD